MAEQKTARRIRQAWDEDFIRSVRRNGGRAGDASSTSIAERDEEVIVMFAGVDDDLVLDEVQYGHDVGETGIQPARS